MKNTLDTLLDIGASFDWITPLWEMVQDFLYGPPAYFGISTEAGLWESDIKKLLAAAGVERIWGFMYLDDGAALMFTVPRAQAELTYRMLMREGIPITHIPLVIQATGV